MTGEPMKPEFIAALSAIDIDKVRQWMPWKIQKYREGVYTSVMTLEEDGCYRRLLDAMWSTQEPVGTMPKDDRQIAQLARVGLRQWNRMKANVLKCFVDGPDGRWHQPDQEKIWEEQCLKYVESRDRARNAGIASGKARQQHKLNKGSTQVQPQVNPVLNPTLTDAPLAPDSLNGRGDGTPPLGGASSAPTTNATEPARIVPMNRDQLREESKRRAEAHAAACRAAEDQP